MTEQKTRKIIELLEELRLDSLGVRDRHDLEAEEMAAKTDPHGVLTAIDDGTQKMVQTQAEEP